MRPGKIIQRNQNAVEIADVVLMRLTNIEQDKVFFRVKTLLQFFHTDFRYAVCSQVVSCPRNPQNSS